MKTWGTSGRVVYDQAGELKMRVYAPLDRKNGITPWELIPRIQDVIAPVDYSIIKTKDRMKAALDEVSVLGPEVDRLKARDYHELARCIDAESMVLCAEMFYRASLMRTESRGFHLREDYPAMDNENWLKWINVKNIEGKMELYTEDKPFDGYPYRPASNTGVR